MQKEEEPAGQSLKMNIIRLAGHFAQDLVANTIKDETVDSKDAVEIQSLNQFVHNHHNCPEVTVTKQCNQSSCGIGGEGLECQTLMSF